MTFHLNQVVPWGRSFEEYVRMFNLTEDDLTKTILGCADGPSSFNAEANQRGYQVVSCDPLFEKSALAIGEEIQATFHTVLEALKANAAEFVWSQFRSPEECGHVRLDAMKVFLKDFEKGLSERRYVAGSLPRLPFGDQTFELALCSHFLFTYSNLLTVEFHREAILELCRVAKEVRIFPIVDLAGQPIQFLDLLAAQLSDKGLQVEKRRVEYEFQRGADHLFRISR